MTRPFEMVNIFDMAKNSHCVVFCKNMDDAHFFEILLWNNNNIRGEWDVVISKKTSKIINSTVFKEYLNTEAEDTENFGKKPSSIIEIPTYAFFFERLNDATLFRLKWA